MRSSFLVLVAALSACGGGAVIDGSGGEGGTAGDGGSGGGNTGGTGATGATGGAGATGGTAGAGGVNCNPDDVFCDGPIPACPVGEVPSVESGCWTGDCVSVLECATVSDCGQCQTGLCAEYTSFTVEYRCVMPTLMCSAPTCGCLAPYFCVAPYDACTDTTGGVAVSCECPAC